MASYGWLYKPSMLLHCWTPYWNFPWFQAAFRGQGNNVTVIGNVSLLQCQMLPIFVFVSLIDLQLINYEFSFLQIYT